MKIDFTNIFLIGVMLFLAVWLGKIVVEWARKPFAPKNENVVDALKTELHALNVKFNVLRNEFDVLKTEVIALKIKSQPAKQVQNSPTLVLKDAHANDEDTWNRDTHVGESPFTSIMPLPAFDDIWAGDAMAGEKTKSPRLRVINENSIT